MVIFKRRNIELELFQRITQQLIEQAKCIELLNKKIDALTIPNPLSEDDWLDIASKKEPKQINMINDVKWPDNWWKGKKPF